MLLLNGDQMQNASGASLFQIKRVPIGNGLRNLIWAVAETRTRPPLQ